jgi:hypothetical protein
MTEMLHMIAKWFISRSIDENRPIPDWLARWVDRNHDLKQFELQSRQLGHRLKSDAPGWIASQALPASEELAGRRQFVTPQRVSLLGKRPIALSLAAGASVLATGILFTVTQLHSHRDQIEKPVSGTDRRFVETNPVETITAADLEWLVRSWKTSRANLGELQTRAWDLPRRTQDWKMPGVSAIVEPAEVAGSTAGRALATLDHCVEFEQKQLTSDIKTAFSFFAYRLPSSMAKLAGLEPPAG